MGVPPRDPASYQPALRWWGHLWRTALVLLIAVVAWAELAHWQWEHDRGWFWADLAGGLLSAVIVTYRRRWPVQTVVATTALGFVSASSGGGATLALVSLATRRRWREIIPLAALSLTQALAFESYNPVSNDPWAITVTASVLVVGITIAIGLYIGSRRELMATLEDRATTAESEQASRISQARTAERTRIAREMHDVLAHRISLVAMHAGALSYREDLDRDEVRKASGVIQDNAHQALVDLREVLGILREDPTSDQPDKPQPTWCDIPRLVEEAELVGMKVRYANALDDASPPERSGRTVYRIIQEGLTNARKHAPDTTVVVQVDGLPQEAVRVEIRNPLRVGDRRQVTPGSGLGLVGLHERTGLSGGTLVHSIEDGEFVLRAWLPWPS